MQINGNDEKDYNPIVAAMCWGFVRYDSNEILQQNTDARTTDNKGHNADYAD